MKEIIVIELPEGADKRRADALITGVRNIAFAMFPESVVTVEVAETIQEVTNGILRDSPTTGGGGGAEGRPGMTPDGPGSDGPGTLGVAEYLRRAESRSDRHTEPPTGAGDGDGDDMTAGRHRGWLRPWRALKRVGAGKHYPR